MLSSHYDHNGLHTLSLHDKNIFVLMRELVVRMISCIIGPKNKQGLVIGRFVKGLYHVLVLY